jgi:hypothetical protein
MKFLPLIFIIFTFCASPKHLHANGGNKGIYIPADKVWMSAPKVEKLLKKANHLDSVVCYKSRNTKCFTASARGTDGKHHIVNSFLVGYAPYKTDNIWIPLQVLARKKVYGSDRKTDMGNDEVWQTSKQAHRINEGDCEDHALALADWLITMGEDARVIIGSLEGNGHAWVVLLKDGKQYLLETTQKFEVKSGTSFPLTREKPGYKPEFMFNRTLFWENDGTNTTTDYKSANWKVKSVYNLGSTF